MAPSTHSRRRQPVRATLRFVAAVMMTSGVLLLADAGVTLAWQEPISAFMASREQDKLEDELANPPRRVLRKDPLKGDAIGKILFPTLDRSYFVIEGIGESQLRKGPGHYPKAPLPGERGTVAIAGHRTTYGAPFRTIDKLKKGQPILVDLPDGRYVYRVQATRIVAPTEISVTRRVKYDRLVLTACHPLYSAAERIVAFARYVRKEPASSSVRRD